MKAKKKIKPGTILNVPPGPDRLTDGQRREVRRIVREELAALARPVRPAAFGPFPGQPHTPGEVVTMAEPRRSQ